MSKSLNKRLTMQLEGKTKAELIELIAKWMIKATKLETELKLRIKVFTSDGLYWKDL